MFNLGILPKRSFDIPVIGIGNLSTGGTGKTPLTEYLVSLLVEKEFKPVVLSRGYKRELKGYIVVNQDHTAKEVGDEPHQLKSKFPEVPVIVAKNRVKAIQKIQQEIPEVDVVVMDDAFQYRYVQPGLNILTTEYTNPFPEDHLLPAGNLREPKHQKKRANIIVVTKNLTVLSPFEEGRLKELIKPLEHQSLYFSYITYKDFIAFNDTSKRYPIKEFEDYKLVLFTGIANPIPLKSFLDRKCKAVELVKFADHRNFTEKDFQKVAQSYKDIFVKEKAVVTTEKDAKRLESLSIKKQFEELPLYYVPIEVGFHPTNEEQTFDEKVIQYVRSSQRNRPLHSRKN